MPVLTSAHRLRQRAVRPRAACSVLTLTLALGLLAPPEIHGVMDFIRGDADRNGQVQISDAVGILGYLFLGNPKLDCRDAADVDDDGRLDISDPVTLLDYLFLGGWPPDSPFPGPGYDPTLDEQTCSTAEPPGGRGPLESAEAELWIQDTAEFTSLVGDGIETTPEVFDLVTRIPEGESILSYESHDPNMPAFISRLRAAMSRPRIPLNWLFAPAGADGCYHVDADLLAGSGQGSRRVESEGLRIQVRPEVVCGLGPHVVEVTLSDASGLTSTWRSIVNLCDRADPDCRLLTIPVSGRTPIDSASSATCGWIATFREVPRRRLVSAEGLTYDTQGHPLQSLSGADVRIGDDSMQFSVKKSGPGPCHTLVAARVHADCPTPVTDYSVQSQGETIVRIYLLCLADEYVVTSNSCDQGADVEALYQGFAHIATYTGDACFGAGNPVVALAQEECLLEVNGDTLFQKALLIERSDHLATPIVFNLGGDLQLQGLDLAGTPEATLGYSHLSLASAGRTSGRVRAEGFSSSSLPLRARLQTYGRADLYAERRADGLAAVLTETAAVYVLGETGCPSASELFFIARLYGSARAVKEVRQMMDDFLRAHAFGGAGL